MPERGERSYDDPCGIARALDLVGERWALLLVRELIFGPKRFTDLRHGLAGASQNVIAQRLRELERHGVVERMRLGPPARVPAYRLTRLGRELEPVLLALARWGSDLPIRTANELSTDALMFALRATYEPPGRSTRLREYEIRFELDQYRVITGTDIQVARGPATDPDAVIATAPDVLRDLVYAGRSLPLSLDRGEITIVGDRSAVRRLITSFRRPPTTE
ncbi:winged helix-turn-helix transcriptional regulator [Microlunatus sp. GCM10028923]|uniref:winged helix-turn-helix transcriptional regulator n=1 Tax=Microlunatus sp. GCM10028923 TaxID=3273400 RepID=UPI00360C51A0